MRYSTAPAYDPKSGMYRGKGTGSKGKKIPTNGAVKIVKPSDIPLKTGSAKAAAGDPRKKVR